MKQRIINILITLAYVAAFFIGFCLTYYPEYPPEPIVEVSAGKPEVPRYFVSPVSDEWLGLWTFKDGKPIYVKPIRVGDE